MTTLVFCKKSISKCRLLKIFHSMLSVNWKSEEFDWLNHDHYFLSSHITPGRDWHDTSDDSYPHLHPSKTLHTRTVCFVTASVHRYVPAGTWRKYNVASTSMQRHDAWRKYNVASTSMQRHDVASTLRRGYDVASTLRRGYDVASTLRRRYIYVVNITSPQRRCNVMTLHRRWGDVIFTSCACRGLFNIKPPQQTHDVNTTSPQRRCNVMTLHRRWADVV